MWDYSDPCHTFPTLFLDLFVDSYFLVRPSKAVFSSVIEVIMSIE